MCSQCEQNTAKPGKDFPSRAKLGNRIMRVLSYEGRGMFVLLGPDDWKYLQHRSAFVFLPDK